MALKPVQGRMLKNLNPDKLNIAESLEKEPSEYILAFLKQWNYKELNVLQKASLEKTLVFL